MCENVWEVVVFVFGYFGVFEFLLSCSFSYFVGRWVVIKLSFGLLIFGCCNCI